MTYFSTASAERYLFEYGVALKTAISKVEAAELERAATTLKVATRVFVGGNGGSSAIADHFACDFEKGAGRPVINLSARPALLSAIANDYGYEYTLSWQLKAANISKDDTVVLISSSGNSSNILDAASVARTAGATLLGLSGFNGGKLREVADISLHIPFHNYGIVEDCHQVLMHVLAQYLWGTK